jgi:hypothetical protein
VTCDEKSHRDIARDFRHLGGLEVYRLANATAAAAEQDCNSRPGADSVIVDLRVV